MVVDTVKITATVEAVDYAKRTVTLKGPEGNTVILKVGEAARNFDQVKVGDKLVAEYFESVALYVKKPGGKPSAGEASMVQMAPRGAKPEGVVVNTTEVTATVQAVDYAKRTVTLKGPEWNTVTLKVQNMFAGKICLRHHVGRADALVEAGSHLPCHWQGPFTHDRCQR